MLFTEKLRPGVNALQLYLLKEKNIAADVLRLDLIDPIISGNKWFKLKEYLKEAGKEEKKAIITFGGAFSNHILATAAICQKNGMQSVGIIRGEAPKNLSPTLQQAIELGMDVFFIDREKYKLKTIPKAVHDKYPDAFMINEGGYGLPGMKGAATILNFPNANKYTHIITAVGSGTTLAGLVEGSEKKQELLGVSSLRNNMELVEQINHLLPEQTQNRFQLFHQYHFGGYAKYNQALIDFMNEWYINTGIPSDFVYTAKMFYAFYDLLKKKLFFFKCYNITGAYWWHAGQ